MGLLMDIFLVARHGHTPSVLLLFTSQDRMAAELNIPLLKVAGRLVLNLQASVSELLATATFDCGLDKNQSQLL